jgi:hypothetical protein
MSKTLRTDQITSELSGSAFFGGRPVRPEPTQEATTQSINQSPSLSTDQVVDPPTPQSTSRSVTQSTTSAGYVDRPKAFYITNHVDERLDDAVRYFQQTHGLKKVDRSMIVNALLDAEALWTDESLDRLLARVIEQLTSRLTGR